MQRTHRFIVPRHAAASELARRRRVRALLAVPLAWLSFGGVVGAETLPDPAPVTAEGASEVTVSGNRGPKYATHDPTAASTVVDGEALHAAGQSSADVLARVPGVQVARTGAQSDLATASIRGSDSSQVPVYVGGVRINDDVSGTADLSTVPLWMIERVEVFRGNAPASSDQLGLGGAIFFWPRLPRATRLGASAHVGSFGSRGGWVAGEVGSARTGALVAVRRDQAANDYPFVNDQGRRFDLAEREEARKNADFVSYDAWAIGRYHVGRGARITTVLNAFERDQGVTGLSIVPAEAARGTARRLLGGASLKADCTRRPDDCAVELTSSLLVAGLALADPRLELPALRSRTAHNVGLRTSHRASVSGRVSPALELGGSVSQSLERFDIVRSENLPRRAHRATTDLAARATLQPASRFRLYGMGALDCQTTDAVTERFARPVRLEGDTCGVLEPVGRVGAGYRVTDDVEILSNVGRYVRVPTLAELYGSSSLVEGNAEVVPERGITVDLGVRAALSAGGAGRYGLDVFGFAREASDLIRFRQTSLRTAAPFNVASARILGMEALVFAEWLRALRIESALTFLDARETTDDGVQDPTANDVLPLTPRLAAASRIEVFAEPGPRVLAQDRAALAVSHLYRASRFDDPAGQTVLPPQSTFDVEALTAHYARRLTLRLAVRNVLDSRQLDFLGLPIAGRSAHAEVEAWW